MLIVSSSFCSKDFYSLVTVYTSLYTFYMTYTFHLRLFIKFEDICTLNLGYKKIIISLRDTFGPPKSLKNSPRAKTMSL